VKNVQLAVRARYASTHVLLKYSIQKTLAFIYVLYQDHFPRTDAEFVQAEFELVVVAGRSVLLDVRFRESFIRKSISSLKPGEPICMLAHMGFGFCVDPWAEMFKLTLHPYRFWVDCETRCRLNLLGVLQ
jgi:hypothetical protein